MDEAKIPTRTDISDSDKWDLTHLFADVGKWQEDFAWLQRTYPKLQDWKGRVGESAQRLTGVLEFEKSLDLKIERVYHYASLQLAEDSTNNEYLARIGQVLNLSDPRKVFVIGAVLCQLQRRVVIDALDLQIERLFELKHSCQRLRRLPYSALPLVKLWIRPLQRGKIFLPFADIGKKMRQVPLIRVGNISASWNFRFVHEEIVTRNALSSTGRTRRNPETSREH